MPPYQSRMEYARGQADYATDLLWSGAREGDILALSGYLLSRVPPCRQMFVGCGLLASLQNLERDGGGYKLKPDAIDLSKYV